MLRPSRIVAALLLTPLLLGAYFQLARIVGGFLDPLQLDYGESAVLWQASQVFDLKSAFHPLQQLPYIPFNYTPFYHVVVNLLARHAAPGHFFNDELSAARFVSMLAAFWTLGIIAWMVFRASRGYASPGFRALTAVVVCCFALQVPSMRWIPLARVDMLGIALQFTALCLLILGARGGRRLWIEIAAVVLLLLGVYTKQSLLAIPAAAFLLVGITRPRRALALASGFAFAGLAVFALFAWATDGGTVKHWVLYNVNRFSFGHAVDMEGFASKNLGPLIAAGLAAAWLSIPRWSRLRRGLWPRPAQALQPSPAARQRPARPSATLSPFRSAGVGFGLVAAIGFLLSLSSGKPGSNINYFLDWQIALCPLAGLFMVLVRRHWNSAGPAMGLLRPLVLFAGFSAAVLLATDSWTQADIFLGWTADRRADLAARSELDGRLQMMVGGIRGPVVSDNMMILLRAGKPILLEPGTIKLLTESGVFDESDLLARTREGYFSAFVLRNGTELERFTPTMLREIITYYRPHPLGGLYTIYSKPNGN